MRGRRAGFSLMELVVVLGMVGLMVAIAVPRIDITGYRANSSLQVLGTTILTAQRQALTQQHDIIVRFDTVNLRLRVHQDRNNNGVVDSTEHIRSVPMIESILFGRGDAPQRGSLSLPISFTRRVSGDRAIIFHRDGSASEGGGFYLTSNKAMGVDSFPEHSRLVIVERSTGRAAAYRYLGGAWTKVF
jgi:prepilin-type N-terminal cleavage/methylation domain-containing protein